MAVLLIYLFVFGAAIGSFLNVVIYRLPRVESWRQQLRCLVTPGSHCPACNAPIAWYDNIPLLGYFFLRGRCRHCGERISPRYLLVEALTAVLYLLAGWHFGFDWVLLPSLMFIAVIIAIFFIDLEHFIIPNIIVLPAAASGLAVMLAIEPGRWLEILIAGIASAAFFFLIVFIKPSGMGMGDVKLGGMMGFYLGKSVLVALFLGILLGALVGVALVLSGRRNRKSPVPFGTFLAVGGLIALFYGEQLLNAYLGIFNQSM